MHHWIVFKSASSITTHWFASIKKKSHLLIVVSIGYYAGVS